MENNSDSDFEQENYVSHMDMLKLPIKNSYDVNNQIIKKYANWKEEEESVRESKYDINAYRNLPNALSYFQALMLLAKNAVGIGILATPEAFSFSGTIGATILILVVGVLGTYTNWQLANCSHNVCRKLRRPTLDYAETAYESFMLGPRQVKRFATTARCLVKAFLSINMFGACAIYIVFVAENWKQVLDYHTKSNVDIRVYMICITILVIFPSLVRNLNNLSLFSTLGMILQMIGIGIICYYYSHVPPLSQRAKFVSNVKTVMIAFGTLVFAIQPVCGLSAIETKMRYPEKITAFPLGVLCVAMFFITIATWVVGFVGYWKYEKPLGSITLNLPANETLAQSVKGMYGLAIFFSFPFCFHISFCIIWNEVMKYVAAESVLTYEYVSRIALTLFTGLIAVAVPKLGALISLTGAMTMSTLAYLFPPVINLATFWNQDEPNYYLKLYSISKDIVLAIFGFVVIITASYLSIVNLTEEMSR